MKLTAKTVAKQSKAIQKFLRKRNAETVAIIKGKYPDLVRAMKKEWDVTTNDLLNEHMYEGLENHIPEDTW